MPGLDYATEVHVTGAAEVSISELFGRPVAASFYDGSPDRCTVKCPDCGKRADAMFGDHGGDCLPGSPVYAAHFPLDALGILRRAALSRPRLCINDVRRDFDKAGVKETSRGPAFAKAVRRGWLEPDGSRPSTGERTKSHRIQTYRSLIYRKAEA